METLFEIEYYNGRKKKINNSFYKNYSKARKRARKMICRKNMEIRNRHWNENPEDIYLLFVEKEPDNWTDGKETIRITVIEVKS
ncbi:MAG: hypothetical protein V1904_12350 [Bacteroidota bacterium]